MCWQKFLDRCLKGGSGCMIRLPIDLKSLYFNIKNDNQSGHTATVATPLKQGKTVHNELAQIYNLPENVGIKSREGIIAQILKNSRAEAIIPHVYVFDKISVNREIIEDIPAFCIYIREETSENNVHRGRQKVHYPPSFKYKDDFIEINNKEVVRAMSDSLKSYAYLIEAFEYDPEEKILNFDALIVGENDVPYSKVFLNKKGVGNKFIDAFNESADSYDTEIIALREHLGYENVGPDNFEKIQKNNKELAIDIIIKELHHKGIKRIRRLSNEYPYSLYDLEINQEGRKHYIIVKSTATKLNYFTMSYSKIKFCMDFDKMVSIALVRDITGTPCIEWYSVSDINNMSKSINSITYEKRG